MGNGEQVRTAHDRLVSNQKALAVNRIVPTAARPCVDDVPGRVVPSAVGTMQPIINLPLWLLISDQCLALDGDVNVPFLLKIPKSCQYSRRCSVTMWSAGVAACSWRKHVRPGWGHSGSAETA